MTTVDIDAQAAPLVQEEVIVTDHYSVTLYRRSLTRLVVVFVSAGLSGPGGPVEEFRKTLAAFGVSMMFVRDRKTMWFNHASTPEVMARIGAIAASYRHVGLIGESMGGSGALLAASMIGGVQRVLSMVPQYSIALPFIEFDHRYAPASRSIPHQFHGHFALAPPGPEVILLYGNTEWRDYLHSAMFAAHRYQVLYVDGASHNVAAYLKYTAQGGGRLSPLVKAFCDFDRPFGLARVAAVLRGSLTQHGIKPGLTFADEVAWQNKRTHAALDRVSEAELGRPLGTNLARLGRATQSSVSPWSRRPTVEEDASGAIDGAITGSYGFHTELERHPWWMVDLGAVHRIDEVRIYNFMAQLAVSARTSRFVLETSADGAGWAEVCRRDDPAPFGGADGRPFVWRPAADHAARFVRIRLTTEDYLHLDEVEVYGT